MAKKTKEKDLIDSFYEKPKIKRTIWVLLIILFFSLGFFNNFDLKKILSNKITVLMNKNSVCKIQFPSPEISFFIIPELAFKKLSIPGECLGLYQDLVLNEVAIQFWGPSIFPFGLKSKIKLNYNKNNLETKLVFSFSSLFAFLDNAKIDLKNISGILPNAPKISGSLNVNLESKISYKGKLELLNLSVNSSNLNIPPQNISNFDLPALPLNLLKLDINQETQNSLRLKELNLGDDATSPLAANFNGKIQLNQMALPYSNIDLKGSLKLKEALTNTLPLLKLLLKKYPLVGDSYQMKIGGTLSMPVPSPAN